MIPRGKVVRLYYLDESEGKDYYVRSALGVNAEYWREALLRIQNWRRELKGKHNIPLFKELHASELLMGKSHIIKNKGKGYRSCNRSLASKIFKGGLECLENIRLSMGNEIEVINICLKKSQHDQPDMASLGRMFNRIQISAGERYVFLIFDEGKEWPIVKLYRKALVFNPTPSKVGKWEDGKVWKNIPSNHIVGGPAFRKSSSDYFLQMADFVAHALLKKSEKPTKRVKKYGLDLAFDEYLDVVLNKKASEKDRQGIVRY